mgnify:CR=1 FL=1|jgi:hypothetical protein
MKGMLGQSSLDAEVATAHDNPGHHGIRSRRARRRRSGDRTRSSKSSLGPGWGDVTKACRRSWSVGLVMPRKGRLSLTTGLVRLHWAAPSRAFPHGLSGLLSVVSGAYLIAASLRGSLVAVSGPILGLYVLSSMVNAAAGLAISGRAAKSYRSVFRSCSIFQLCLIYYCWRFSPSFPAGAPFVTVLDSVIGVLTVLGIASFTFTAVVQLPLAIGVAVIFGSFALALLSGYPLQLGFLGQEWLECVQATYPKQGPAMVAYIYVPATWAFAVMLFGATLWIRKLIGDLALGGGFAGVVVVTLVSTVLMQEVHFPEPVSTQKLWLPCPAPPADSWSAWAVVHLDTSALARSALALLKRLFSP